MPRYYLIQWWLVIIWTLTRRGVSFSQIWIYILRFSLKDMYLTMFSATWQPFCLHLSVLYVCIVVSHTPTAAIDMSCCPTLFWIKWFWWSFVSYLVSKYMCFWTASCFCITFWKAFWNWVLRVIIHKQIEFDLIYYSISVDLHIFQCGIWVLNMICTKLNEIFLMN